MPRDPSLRQRGNRRYSFADHGNTEMGQRQGNYLIKNNLADIWSPTYGDGVTTMRIFPQLNVDDPNRASWDPYRFSPDANDFGDWIRRYPAVRNMGDPGVTYIMADPADPTLEDPQMLPGWVLFNAIDRAVANQQEQQGWAALLRGGRGRGAQLPRPSEVYLVQCAIMQHKQQVYGPPKGFQPEDKPIVMALSASAGLAMIAEMNQLNEGAQADGDWETLMRFGDPVGLDTGRFITFYKLADGDPRQRQQAAATGWNQPAAGGVGGQGGRQGEPIGYGAYIEPTFNGMPARLREYEQFIASKVKPWDEILHFPTVEEQAHLLADKFDPSVILYAFRDHPDWIPESIRNRAVARTQVEMPGATPGVEPGAMAGWGGAPPAGAPPVGPPPAQAAGMPPQAFPTEGQAPVGAPPAQTTPVGTTEQVNPTYPPQQPVQGGFGAPPAAPPAAAPPQGGFGAPPAAAPPQGGFGAPPTGPDPAAPPAPGGFGAPPAAAPPVGATPGVQPTGGPPPAAAPGQPPTAFGAQPPAAAPPAAAPPAAAPQPQGFVDPNAAAAQMSWGQQGNTAAAPPAQAPQQPVQPQHPAAAPPAQAPPAAAPPQPGVQQPAQGFAPQPDPAQPQEMSRAQAALAAAQRAAGQ